MMLNISNAMFGVGMIVIPLVLHQLFANSISWRAVSQLSLAAIILSRVFVTRFCLPVHSVRVRHVGPVPDGIGLR